MISDNLRTSDELMSDRVRMTITVSQDAYDVLQKWADEEERTAANLAAYLLSKAAKEHEAKTAATSDRAK